MRNRCIATCFVTQCNGTRWRFSYKLQRDKKVYGSQQYKIKDKNNTSLNPQYPLCQFEKHSIMPTQEKKWLVIDDEEMDKGIEIIPIIKEMAGTSVFTEVNEPIWHTDND